MKAFKFLALFTLSLLSYVLPAAAQVATLQSTIEEFIASKDAVVAVAVAGNAGKDHVFIQADKQLPMQSVFKFHIAIAMLREVDRGKFKLAQPITIGKELLLPDTWSPLRDKYPTGVTLPLSEIITFMVAQSDNIACDLLLKLLGGPAVVDAFFKAQGVNDLSIKINEETMQSDWEQQFKNWTTARSCNVVLEKYFYNKNKELSATSHAFLWTVMKSTETGAKRLKGDLPTDVTVAHKTGYSGIKNGIAEAVHDIGIIFPTNGEPIFISVLISHSKESLINNEAIIAHIAKLCYDYFEKNN
ncbi:class A beta-lactamase [Sphingobacterium oryzagri]|uniref:beta-lactamase n=1 Tax=Sphingobacterium oryzagri TaxID=3025669 RepID=A0ABY7WCK0_9SPHI|nr:class A beta-lactamase [Sphingobacterium sp. KACC 22765]WDF67202.1 class A beta-lactamase [Sphingobacterium sp. KACC 22765]